MLNARRVKDHGEGQLEAETTLLAYIRPPLGVMQGEVESKPGIASISCPTSKQQTESMA